MSDKKDIAIGLARRGFRVFPLSNKPGAEKTPARKGWQASATDSVDEIQRAWREGQNPGIATDRLVVIDADVAKGGLAALEKLFSGKLPPTYRVRTGSGGMHVYFRAPEGVELSTRACTTRADGTQVPAIIGHWGLDVRAKGGLAVGAGSVFNDGSGYTVENDAPLLPCPDFLVELLKLAPVKSDKAGIAIVDTDQPHQIDVAKRYLANDAPRGAMPGSRGWTAYVVASRLGDFGISRELAYELMEPWNDEHGGGQDAEELLKCVEHSYSYRQEAIGVDDRSRVFDTIVDPPRQQQSPLQLFETALQWAGHQFGTGLKRAMVSTGGPNIPALEHAPLAASLPAPTTLATPALIRVCEFADRPVPAREVHTFGIPAKAPTLIMGDGGTGKSLIAAQNAVATVIDGSWLGHKILRPGPVLYIGAEDDRDEMHRRFATIAAKSDTTLEALTDLHLLCLAGEDAVLGAVDRGEIVKPTALWRRVCEMIADIRPTIVFYDTLADIFAGNENSRTQARQFISQLRAPAIQFGATTVLLAHPSLTGLSTGTGTSGSTGWSNSVRSRLYLSRVTSEGREPDPDLRALRVMKANYDSVGHETKVYWREGVFVPDAARPAHERSARDAAVERLFLELLASFNASSRDLSDTPSPTYAPSVFEREPGSCGFTKAEFAAAMSRLFHNKLIRVEIKGPPSRQRRRLRPA